MCVHILKYLPTAENLVWWFIW